MKKTLGVFIGRFQPIHLGHLQTLRKMFNECDYVLVAFGSSFRAPDTKNPFSFEERAKMVREAAEVLGLPTQLLFTVGLRDYPYCNTKWQYGVQKVVVETMRAIENPQGIPPQGPFNWEVVLYGTEKDASSFYLKLFPQWRTATCELLDMDNNAMSATVIREAMFNQPPEDLEKVLAASCLPETINSLQDLLVSEKGQWLRGEYIWEQRYMEPYKSVPFPPVFQTVDNVVLWRGLVLLIERKHRPGMGLWALPGGFININETRRDAAIRELEEEGQPRVFRETANGLKRVPMDESWIVGSRGFDHPGRSRRGRIITEAYLWRIPDNLEVDHKASDDAAKSRFFPLQTILDHMGEKLFEDHQTIIAEMTLRN